MVSEPRKKQQQDEKEQGRGQSTKVATRTTTASGVGLLGRLEFEVVEDAFLWSGWCLICGGSVGGIAVGGGFLIAVVVNLSVAIVVFAVTDLFGG